ncbi:hypothetical protein GCM10025868_07000 [Angustibacter aerolatus]|uniref:Hflx-type G domain-containing protein n=1 Tax=Angustibacter aerolatus TaxID=1162965 RepID=A0ABQ6JF52_9ACTN|nr:GTPase [Angustibacter aerolatus]GMA85450.1 hypothetical protein GCM10025868_07000 [Angustibacter aerolatus]
MSTSREVGRHHRRALQVPSVAIAGYTNAGKSSILNRLTGAGVLVEDALFATLDPTVRRTRTPDGREFTLSDTVGFVRRLPHQLVEAFRSTLEEVAESDLVLHVVDGSDPDPEGQIAAVREVLADVDAQNLPEPARAEQVRRSRPRGRRPAAPPQPDPGGGVGAHRRRHRGACASGSPSLLPHPRVEVEVLVPYERGDLVSRVHVDGEVLDEEHTAAGTRLRARVGSRLAAELEPYPVA